ncbi:putative ribonuclease H-like domain-containing protein [Tanacetum coccineum]
MQKEDCEDVSDYATEYGELIFDYKRSDTKVEVSSLDNSMEVIFQNPLFFVDFVMVGRLNHLCFKFLAAPAQDGYYRTIPQKVPVALVLRIMYSDLVPLAMIQMDGDDLEELDLKWQVAELTVRVQKRSQGKRTYGDNDRSKASTNESSSQALVAQDGLGGYDWSNDFELEPVNYALNGISSSLIIKFSGQTAKLSKAKLEIQGYELALESLESRILGHERNELAWGEKYEFQNYELKCREIKIDSLTLELEKVSKERDDLKKKTEAWEASSKHLNSSSETQTNEVSSSSETDSEISVSVFDVRSSDEDNTSKNDRFANNEFHAVPPPITGNYLTPRADISFAGLDELAIRKKIIATNKATCKFNVDKPKSVSESVVSNPKANKEKVIIEDWTSDDEDEVSVEQTVSHVKARENQTIKTRVDKIGVLTRTGLAHIANPASTVRPNVSTTRPNASTVRPNVSTARPFIPKIAQTGGAIRPNYPRMDNVRPKVSSFQINRTSTVVNAGKGHLGSKWVWMPKGNPEILLHDQAVVDSSCSCHMTGNKAYLSDYEDYNGGFVAFGSNPKGGRITGRGKIKTANLDFDDVYFVDELNFKLLDESQVVLRAHRKDDVYSLDLKNIVPSGCITCLYANATSDESKLWHRRLGHVNFKNINKLVKGNLVRGLPSKVFINDHTCVAYKKGKQHKASCKAKLERTIRKPLELLHMDLFGPVFVDSINKKRYCLVVTDDFSRFSWVFFLATKDETSEILYNFIIGLENQLNHTVKIIRCDNGTEFKNHIMNEFCAKKGIKREFSVAKTPQQNDVAERKNMTLIEAARTMLADSLLPIPFWAEAVNTACYVLNRVLVTKPQNKTPYELLMGKPPSISFMRPFGCPLTILNTLDSLGKFDGKSDEGYLLGYSTTCKAFRVYNKRTKRVEENLHIDFLEDQPNVAGKGPDWMFDLDFLTNTMNYIPVSVENQVTVDAGIQESNVASASGKNNEVSQEYILLPIHPHRTKAPIEAVVQDAHEKPSENATNDKDVQNSEDDVEQTLQDELEKMISQEMVAQAVNNVARQEFDEDKRNNVSSSKATSTNILSTDRPNVSTTNSDSTANADFTTDPSMTGLENDSNEFSNKGIFKEHKNIIQALQAESWVEAMQEELLQFKLQKVWVLVDLPYGKKEEGIDYDEVFAPVTRIEAIRLFLAFASYMGFTVYQMDVKSAFLYGTIGEEVYVHQPPGFIDPAHPNKVYKVIKALYGLYQAPRAWYETLSSFLMENGFRRGTIDKTLFIKKTKKDIMLVQVYVDDIIFGSTKKSLCTEFEECMHKRFQMSSMGELTFFWGLQVKTATTPIESNKPLVKDEDVDVHIYRFQVTPKASHLNTVKRIFRYLKHQPKLGLWYPKDSPFDLEAYSNSDYGGVGLGRKSTTGGCQFLGRRLISWQFKKQTIVANSTSEADVIKNPVAHSRTKHIEIRFHFIRDCYEKRLIEVIKIHTDHNVADLLTKGFDITRFNFLIVSIGMLNLSSLDSIKVVKIDMDGTKAFLLPNLLNFSLTKVSTDSAIFVPMGKVSTDKEPLEKIPSRV